MRCTTVFLPQDIIGAYPALCGMSTQSVAFTLWRQTWQHFDTADAQQAGRLQDWCFISTYSHCGCTTAVTICTLGIVGVRNISFADLMPKATVWNSFLCSIKRFALTKLIFHGHDDLHLVQAVQTQIFHEVRARLQLWNRNQPEG